MIRLPAFLQRKSARKIGIIAHDCLASAMFASILARHLSQQTPHRVFAALQRETLAVTPQEHFEQIYTVQNDPMEVLPYFLAERFDYIINLTTDSRVKTLLKALEVTQVIDENWHLKKGLLRYLSKKNEPMGHLLDHLLAALRPFGVKDDQRGLQLTFASSKMVDLMEMFDPFIYAMMYHGGFVLFFIENDEHYSIEQIVAVCQKINQPVLLIGNSATNSIAAAVAKECGPNIIDATVLSKMQYLPSLIEQCQRVYTFDNDLSQILGAFSKPVTLIRNSQAVELSRSLYFPMEKRHLLTIRTIAALS